MEKSQKSEVESLLSKQTVEKLDTALMKGNMEQLKRQMEKLFTFKNIFNLHDDHLADLAETIIDMFETNDRLGYIHETKRYAQLQIKKYQDRKRRITAKKQWAKAADCIDKMDMLDLTYRVWVYESGFEYSKYQMLNMLLGILRKVEEYEKENMS